MSDESLEWNTTDIVRANIYIPQTDTDSRHWLSRLFHLIFRIPPHAWARELDRTKRKDIEKVIPGWAIAYEWQKAEHFLRVRDESDPTEALTRTQMIETCRHLIASCGVRSYMIKPRGKTNAKIIPLLPVWVVEKFGSDPITPSTVNLCLFLELDNDNIPDTAMFSIAAFRYRPRNTRFIKHLFNTMAKDSGTSLNNSQRSNTSNTMTSTLDTPEDSGTVDHPETSLASQATSGSCPTTSVVATSVGIADLNTTFSNLIISPRPQGQRADYGYPALDPEKAQTGEGYEGTDFVAPDSVFTRASRGI